MLSSTALHKEIDRIVTLSQLLVCLYDNWRIILSNRIFIESNRIENFETLIVGQYRNKFLTW